MPPELEDRDAWLKTDRSRLSGRNHGLKVEKEVSWGHVREVGGLAVIKKKEKGSLQHPFIKIPFTQFFRTE